MNVQQRGKKDPKLSNPVWRCNHDEATPEIRVYEKNKENAIIRPCMSGCETRALAPLYWRSFGSFGNSTSLMKPKFMIKSSILMKCLVYHRVMQMTNPWTKNLHGYTGKSVTDWMRWTSEFFSVCYGFSDKDSQSFTSKTFRMVSLIKMACRFLFIYMEGFIFSPRFSVLFVMGFFGIFPFRFSTFFSFILSLSWSGDYGNF